MRKSKIERPVLRYHGGKFLLAKWIISYFPVHRIYVELFGGAASVLMQKARAYAEVYNDKWDTVVNVFQVLRDPTMANELERQLRLTPYARTEFDKCGELDIIGLTDPIEKARRTILRSFAGFGSASTNNKHSTGFRGTSKKSGTTPAMDWVNYPDNIQSFVQRLTGVTIENKCYTTMLELHDTKQTLFFADPPYVHETRNMKRGNAAYEHEMTNDQHVEMITRLNNVKGMVVLCGYENEVYSEMLADWKQIKKETHADGARDRTECLWLNPHAASKVNRKLFEDYCH